MPYRVFRQRTAVQVAACVFILVMSLGGCAKSREVSAAARGSSSSAKEAVKVTFIELGSVSCIPCQMMQPIMREVETTFPHDVDVVFHDVWTEKGKPYATQYKISVIPTQVFLDAKGKEFYRHQGFFPRDELIRLLKEHGAQQ